MNIIFYFFEVSFDIGHFGIYNYIKQSLFRKGLNQQAWIAQPFTYSIKACIQTW